MIGSGLFAAVGPAASAAGGGLLLGLVVAAAVAYCNATSSARLAARYPESGGTYVYGRERLGHFWGHLAGWGFVVGKTASCAAMALTFGAYAGPTLRRPLAVGAVLAVTLVNLAGVRKTVGLTKIILAVVLVALAAGVVGSVGSPRRFDVVDLSAAGPGGVLQSAGLLFFAFAGYARIATLGEEVTDPVRTIRRAIPIALAVTLGVYLAVIIATVRTIGVTAVARSRTPLADAVRAGPLEPLVAVVSVGACVAALGVLLSLLVGVSRTAFAMGAAGDLPRWLGAVHPVRQVPQHAELAVGSAVALAVLVVDLRGAIGFSAFTVLTYYAIANASALTLPGSRVVPALGLAGCGVLAFSLPLASVVGGVAVLGLGALAWALRRVRRRS